MQSAKADFVPFQRRVSNPSFLSLHPAPPRSTLAHPPGAREFFRDLSLLSPSPRIRP